MSALGRAALDYAGTGWPVFPCVPHSKEPLTRRGFKDASTDPDQIRQWWSRWPAANIAVATGAPGPDVIDIDTKQGRHGLVHYHRAHDGGHLHNPVAVIRTPSGGLHLWFEGTGQRGGAIGRDKALELKAVGGYVLLPPSRVICPELGYDAVYHVIEYRNDPSVVDFAAIKLLLNPASTPIRTTIRAPRRAGEVSPGDDFNHRTDWHDLLTSHGWTYIGQRGTTRYWRRPGKDRGVSATTNALGTDRLHVFTSSTDFDLDSYNKFGALAVLDFGGDFRETAAWLRRNGYGPQRQRTVAA